MKSEVRVAVGYAADECGAGIAYVRIGRGQEARTLRVPFTVKRFPALLDREVGYGALYAVAHALRRRGFERIELDLDDPHLAKDLREHRELPAALTLGYVRLRCALNQFHDYRIAECDSGESDLGARARSEVALHVAA